MKALATILRSFNFSSFASEVEPAAPYVLSLSPYNVLLCSFVIRSCYVSGVVLLLTFFYTFSCDVIIFDIMHFCLESLRFIVKAYRILSCLQIIFIACVIESFFLSHLFVCLLLLICL